MLKSVWVAAAVIIAEGRVLLSQRRAGTHLAGAWEFPGGKVEAGEDPRATVTRELREELGVDVEVGEILDVTHHAYPEKAVTLLFFSAALRASSPAPQAIEVAAYKFATVHELIDEEFPAADWAVLRKVRALLSVHGVS
jgi:8-oxo-dGTP diphosphatase